MYKCLMRTSNNLFSHTSYIQYMVWLLFFSLLYIVLESKLHTVIFRKGLAFAGGDIYNDNIKNINTE